MFKSIKFVVAFLLLHTISMETRAISLESDSLKLTIRQTDNDSLKAYAYAVLSLNYRAIDSALSKSYLDTATELAYRNPNNILEQARVLYLKGTYAGFYMEFDTAVWYVHRALEIALEKGYPQRIMDCYWDLGYNYMRMAKYDQSVKYYTLGLQYADSRKDTLEQTYLLSELASVYGSMDENEQAQKLLERALVLIELKQIWFPGYNVAYNLGVLYENKKEHDQALSYYKKALDYASKIERGKNYIPTILAGMGRSYLQLHNLEEAGSYLLQAYHMNDTMYFDEKGFQLYQKQEIESLLAQWHMERNDMPKALTYAKSALDLAVVYSEEDVAKRHELLSKIYEKMGDHRLALEHFKAFKTGSDSLLNAEKLQQIAEINTKYEISQKDLQLNEMEQERQMQASALEQANQEKVFIGVIAGLFFLLFLVTIYFILQLRRSKRQLQAANQELTSLNGVKDKFFAIIAHDLRSSVTSFQGIGALIKSYIDKGRLEQLKQVAQNMDQSADRLNNLLNNLLNWAFSQLGSIPYHPEKINLKEVADEVIELSMNLAQVKNITVKHKSSTIALAYADANAFRLVLRNLLHNAIKFTPQGGEINIVTSMKEGQLVVKVQDNGIGMENKQLNHLFDISEKTVRKGTNNEAGSGLGLTICKEFVQLNKGKIGVESEVGKGTQVWFTLPVAA